MTTGATTMTGLRVAEGIELPIDYVVKTAAILAQRRKGKTYTANVIAEELVKAKLPFVAIDPTGAWWGLRSSADGQTAGLPVTVLGGQHGHAPLDADHGAVYADLVLDKPSYYVLDLSLLEHRAAERRFATDFATRLHRRKMQPRMDFPLHLFVDEADLFVPQEKEGAGDLLMLGAFQGIVRRGGLHGLGTTLISQRPALVNKSVLTQLDLLILLRLVAGNDQDAVDKNYVKRAGTPEQRADLMGSLASLAIGEAWLWEPGAEPSLFERVRIRERETYNSSATPKPGEKRVEPRVLADVDLAVLEEALAATIEKVKADDPALLRQTITERNREITELRASLEPIAAERDGLRVEGDGLRSRLSELEELLYAAEARPAEPTIVKVPVLDPAVAERTEKLYAALGDTATEIGVLAGEVQAGLKVATDAVSRVAHDVAQATSREPRDSSESRSESRVRQRAAEPSGRVGTPVPARSGSTPSDAGGGSAPEGIPVSDYPVDTDEMKDVELLLLRAIVQWHPTPVDSVMVCATAKRSPRSSTTGTTLARLRTRGLVVGTGEMRATQAAIDLIGEVPPPPSAHAGVEYLLGMLTTVQTALLRVLLDAHPRTFSPEELATASGYSVTSSSFQAASSWLRSKGFAEGKPAATRAAEKYARAWRDG